MKKAKIRRDRQALDKTFQFVSDRGLPTNSGQVAKKFGVSRATASSRLSALATQKRLARLKRGSFVAPPIAGPTLVPDPQGGLGGLLKTLKKRRAEIDGDIKLVEQAIGLRKKWGIQ